MGNIETDAKKRRRKAYLQDAILATLAVTGVVALALVAPNTLQLLGGFSRGRNRFNERSKSAVKRLVQKGYVKFETEKGKTFVRITQQGQKALEEESLRALQKAPQTWDGRWRLIVFDIPERRRAVRNQLRRKVIELGFLKVQNSVWVFPYDCEELVALLKADLRIGKDVLYALVETIEREQWILNHFKLSR